MASKRFKALVVTGLAAAVLAGIPAISSAKNYTGKLPASAVEMMPVVPSSAVTTPVSTTVKKHKKVTSASKKTKKLSGVSTKHKKLTKLKKLGKKVKH